MAKIIITEFMDEAAVANLAAKHSTLYDPKLVDDSARLLSLLPEARALIVRNRTQVRGDILKAGANLTVIGRLGVGLDNIDIEACKTTSITVIPASGANDTSVAEWVITCAMMLLRGAYHATDAMIAGEWPRNRLMGRELCGRIMGLVGYGAIAREVATRARALGMVIAAYDPHLPPDHPAWSGVARMNLEDLLGKADVISLHVPLTGETKNLINAESLALMSKDTILLNAARGGVVEEAALASALKAGTIGGAALDVFEEEPLTAAKATLFKGCPNLILTPHIAGVTVESNIRVSTLIADKVLHHLEFSHLDTP